MPRPERFGQKEAAGWNRFAMGVETGIRSRLQNRHATAGQERAPAAGLTPRPVRQPFGLIDMVAVAGSLDVNLNGAERAERKTNWQRRATNHTSVVFRTYAQRIGPVAGGALTFTAGAYEKLRYVDV
jgi:hypothetical protein